MRVLDNPFEQDYNVLADNLSDWIAEYMADVEYSKEVVIGISGGVDSAVSAALAVRALGAYSVHALLLPHAESNPYSEKYGKLVCESLGIQYEVIDITHYCIPFFEDIPSDAYVRRGNIKARIRMITLFDKSAEIPALVLGTGNKTEILLGYTTLHGDDACGLNPLANVYKTEVWELAKVLGIPEAIITRVPSADLWPNQTDEGELGISYFYADKILFGLKELNMPKKELIKQGYPAGAVERILSIVNRMAYKSCCPAIPPRW